MKDSDEGDCEGDDETGDEGSEEGWMIDSDRLGGFADWLTD